MQAQLVNAAANVTISGKSSDYISGLYVTSQSTTGTAGDIIVTSPRVTLDNSGTLNAESASGNGGNINLQSDLLLLRRGALKSLPPQARYKQVVMVATLLLSRLTASSSPSQGK
jgi:large exoprotein involved in heme utilization and adhesion